VQLRDVVVVAIGVLGPPTSFQVNRLAKTFLNPPGTGPADNSPPPSPTSIIPLQPVSSIDSSLPISAAIQTIRTGVALTRSLSLGHQDAPAKPTLWQRLCSTPAWSPLQEGLSTEDSPSKLTPNSIQESPTPTLPQCYPRMTTPRPVTIHLQYPNFTPGDRDLRWETSESHPDWTWVGPLLWVYSHCRFQ
jgi:hypothetical protein